jgi:tetratricopeptide (TPR) repeat protein
MIENRPRAFSASQYAARGAAEFAEGRFQEAALSYSAVAASQPDNLDAVYNLALCLQRCERWDAAAEAFERVLREDTGWTGARLGLGACLLHMDHAQEALEHFERAANGDAWETALFGQAVALQLLDRFERAREIYARLLDSERHAEEALANWIALGIRTHDLKRVREHSLRLLKLSPHSTAALQGLAAVALEDGDYEAAASYCGRLLDMSPDCLEAWHNLRIAIGQLEFGLAEPAFTLYAGGNR